MRPQIVKGANVKKSLGKMTPRKAQPTDAQIKKIKKGASKK